ncbi:MAG: translocation/assembly module TamB domain-containing protein [Acetobacter papayae]|uniref:translocation/assembly module TamB domain-containing protein n=1 Tax=Acetobacter papayae TaxID=1076592 RepID=UPI0039EB7504
MTGQEQATPPTNPNPPSAPGKPPRALWRRVGRIVLAVFGGLVGLVLLVVAGLLIWANTGAGRAVLLRQTEALTGGMVRVAGISGRFPDNFRLQSLEVRDATGPWLTLRDLHLDWSVLALLGRTARVNAFTADTLDLTRLPVSEESKSEPETGTPSWHALGVDIRKLSVRQITLGAPVMGQAAQLSLSGHGRLGALGVVVGNFSLTKIPGVDIGLDLKRLDRAGMLSLATTAGRGRLELHLKAQDGVDGFLATRLDMAQLAPVALQMDLAGPVAAAALHVSAQAGSTTAQTDGVLDLVDGRMDRLDAQAHAPALTLSDTLGWKDIAFSAHLSGMMSAPLGNAELSVDRLVVAGSSIGTLQAHFTGEGTAAQALAQALHLSVKADGVTVPGKAPLVLAAAPLELDARLLPQAEGKPLSLSLNHPLLELAAQARTAAPQTAALTLKLPDLLPLGEALGIALRGKAGLEAHVARPAKADGATQVTASGTLGIAGGQPQLAGLIGPDGQFALAADITPLPAEKKPQPQPASQRIELQSLTLDGRGLHLKTQGRMDTGRDMDVSASVGLPDLSMALPFLRGGLDVGLTAQGPLKDFAAHVHVQGNPGTAEMTPAPMVLDAALRDLPGVPQGTVDLHGTMDHAPLTFGLTMDQQEDGAHRFNLTALSWKSLQGEGELSLKPGEVIPMGALGLKITKLADLRPAIGKPLAGNLTASLSTDSTGDVPVVHARLEGRASLADMRLDSLALKGDVRDPAGKPAVDLSLKLGGIAAQGITGSAHLGARGPLDAMVLDAGVGPASWGGKPLSLATEALLDVPDQKVTLRRLNATARGENLKLQGPAVLTYGATMGVDHLRATLGAVTGGENAVLDIKGHIKPTLTLNADLRNLTPALAEPFSPGLRAQGVVSASAALTGTLAQPHGQVNLTGNGLRMGGSLAVASVPPLGLTLNATLNGNTASVRGHAHAGSKFDLSTTGTVPLHGRSGLDVMADGALDLSLANGVLGAQGRQALGQARMGLRLQGSLATPRVSGAVTLEKADFQDFAAGVHLSDINGRLVGNEGRLVIQSLTAKAGSGTVEASGAIGIAEPGLPIDMKLMARNARPIASDLLTAVLDADLSVRGQARGRMDVVGSVTLKDVEVNIPNSLPTSVARLDVIRPGEKPEQEEEARAASVHKTVIALSLDLISPGRFFVRGHGLDAEMAGRLKITGTAQAPQVGGGFTLKRGNFNLAGISLNFTKGRVAFNGSGVGHKLDPTLDFQADRVVNGETAMLKVGGYASSPKITFESLPPQPQDQVLAMLLFGTDARSLSSTQMVELGAAVATLTGLTPFDPMGTLRKTLHLDRLTIGGGNGSNANGSGGGASVEAGKYVMKGVYVGAKQATSGSGTQAQVQVDLTKSLKLNTTVGTGGNVTGFTTPENDPGSSVGILWQHRY